MRYSLAASLAPYYSFSKLREPAKIGDSFTLKRPARLTAQGNRFDVVYGFPGTPPTAVRLMGLTRQQRESRVDVLRKMQRDWPEAASKLEEQIDAL